MATPKLSLCLAAAFAVVFAVPAAAAGPGDFDVRSTEVPTGDLDLSRADGQQLLQGRIDRAVRKVCRSDGVRSLRERQDVARCEENAKAGAQLQAEERIAESGQLRKQLARARRLATDN